MSGFKIPETRVSYREMATNPDSIPGHGRGMQRSRGPQAFRQASASWTFFLDTERLQVRKQGETALTAPVHRKGLAGTDALAVSGLAR